MTEENLLKVLQAVFVTKEEFYKFDEKFSLRFDEILNSNDIIAKKITDLYTEVASFHGGQMRQDDTLNNHEHRLKTIESSI
ncbi:MAG: hypothetical protein HY462_00855 [Parcubacteria group bacterium]|nr:hypothetical protein [Parcubacteria group bacterium]